MEIWKDIPQYVGLYQVSNLGRVRSLPRQVGGPSSTGPRIYPGKILEPQNHGLDYLTVRLSRSNKAKGFFIHRLVLEVFVGPCPEGMEACHFPDRCRQNNRVENLRWDTPKANQDDRISHGTDCRGQKHHAAKLTDDDVRNLRSLYQAKMYTRSELAKRFGVALSQVCKIVDRKSWKYLDKVTQTRR